MPMLYLFYHIINFYVILKESMVKLDNPEDYEFIRFEVNDKGTQKYKAILLNTRTGNEVNS